MGASNDLTGRKSKFGAAVRSKLPVAQMNEILAKLVCHNPRVHRPSGPQ